jgi:hypothetical protein
MRLLLLTFVCCLTSGCFLDENRMMVSALCNDGTTSVRFFNTWELSDAEKDQMASMEERSLCVLDFGVFKLHSRMEY